VADLAIQAAERLVVHSLDEAKQRKLVEDYMRELETTLPEDSRH
jgi:F0F1-type ATP synthase membrane subunit b/b'